MTNRYISSIVKLFLLSLFATTDTAIGQSSEGGCTSAGVTSCCQSEPCQVPTRFGSCFCDETCYSTRDCCNDIEFICPPPTPAVGSGDDIMGSGSGSGAPPTTETTPTDFPPSITVFEPSRLIVVDSTMITRLFINVTYDPGHPQGLLEWRHNGAIISSRTDPRVSILSRGGLSIRNIKPSDRGLYSVRVSNSLGNESENFSVLIKFINISLMQVDTTGDEASFGCLAIGYPHIRFVTWQSAAGVNVTAGSQNITLQHNFYEIIVVSTLRGIDPLTCHEAGGYVCVYDNGEDSSTAISSEVLGCPIPLVEVGFEESSYSFTEKSGSVEVCVMANYNTSTSPINVSVTATSGTAQAGVDYMLTNQELTLLPNASRSCVNISILDDLNTEGTEQFELTLQTNSSSALLTESSTTVSIEDDDSIELIFEESQYIVSESLASISPHLALQVCVVQNRRPGQLVENPQAVDVVIATVNGTAKGGDDFVPFSTTQSFFLSSADTRVCECIQPLPDEDAEGREYFLVTVSSQHPLVVGSFTRIKILDDDEVKINLERTQYFVKEDMNTLEVCVTATGGREMDILTVYICTFADTATDDVDYKGLKARRLMFPRHLAPSSSATKRVCVSIPIIDDVELENSEKFLVKLQKDPRMPASVVIGHNSAAHVTILDNDAPDAVYIDNTPLVHGNSVQINFTIHNRGFNFSHIQCTLTGPGKTPPITRNCSQGMLLFSDLPPRYQEFRVIIEGVLTTGSRTLLSERAVRLDTDVCSTHLVNEGISGSGTNRTIQWQGTGPSPPQHRVCLFTCHKDHTKTGTPCESPFSWTGLSAGVHSLTILPVQTYGCRRYVPRVFHFTV